jgi:ribosome maturation factor RimP
VNRTFITRVNDAIESFLAEFTAGRGIFPVEIEIRGQKDNLVVEVFIDGDTGVDAVACAEISRALGKTLDDGALRGEPYTLTVSSPGLDRPLKFPRQYPKHAGRGIALVLRSGEATERFRGVLLEAGAESISVRAGAKGAPREIRFADIVEAKIEPRW